MKKVTPLFHSNPPLKIEILSSPRFWQFGRRLNHPAEREEVVHTMLSLKNLENLSNFEDWSLVVYKKSVSHVLPSFVYSFLSFKYCSLVQDIFLQKLPRETCPFFLPTRGLLFKVCYQAMSMQPVSTITRVRCPLYALFWGFTVF